MTKNDTVTGRSEYACRSLKLKKGRSKHTGDEMLTINGSLATYRNGNNLHSLTSQEFGSALEELSDELNIDCGQCFVWRVEFAGTFNVESKPTLYFPFFQARPGLNLKHMEFGLYLQQVSENLVIYIYDKSDNQNANMLRLEERRRKVASTIGKRYPVLASDLATPKVFENFAKDWHKQMTSVLVAPGKLPVLPERLSRSELRKLTWHLCCSNPATLSTLRGIVEPYYRVEGGIEKNFRAELRRGLHSPHSELENRKRDELASKIEALYRGLKV